MHNTVKSGVSIFNESSGTYSLYYFTKLPVLNKKLLKINL